MSDENQEKAKSGSESFWTDMGCLPFSIGLAILYWAWLGFPGLIGGC